ncbi:Glutamine-rich protein 2, partial [Eurypyga helias]
SSVTGSLLADSQQKQKEIEALLQSLQRLQKDKADREDVELGIDVKADKAALARKVSRSQFEACVERLNETIQEMQSRVTEQEQGWHQFQGQLREGMDSKLDRLELGPFRQQLEKHCRRVAQQLQKERWAQGEDAAGIKKQLLAHFHCLSCDRPLDMQVPG